MKSRIRRFGTIEKIEHQADGTLKVFGIASTEDKDDAGETVLASAMKAAIPGYMKWGAVREMHGPSAAGTALEASVNEKGQTLIGVHVVDPVAITKVETGTYKGFSIGAKVNKRNATNKTIIEDIDLIEVSLVDRPMNPNATITVVKAADADVDDTEPPAEPAAEPSAAPAVEAPAEAPPAPAAEEVAKAAVAPVKKGMWAVSQFADFLQSLCYMAESAESEAVYEADNSPVPAKLRAWVAEGAAIFGEMAAEEVAEMLRQIHAVPAVKEAAARVAGPDVIAKAAQADDTLAKLGVVTTERDEAVAKVAALTATVAERDAAIKKIYDETVAMTEHFKQKGILRFVEKSADGGASPKVDEDPLDPTDPDSVAKMIKKAHASPGKPLGVRPVAVVAQ